MSKTLSKALYLLTLFDEQNLLQRLDDLSQKANIPKPTTYRLLRTLEEYGFVQKAHFFKNGISIDTEFYQLGIKCLELGAMVSHQFEVRNLALPYMTELQNKTNESIQLAIYDTDEAVYVEKVEGTKSVRLYTKIGKRAPLHAGACPRLILSFLPDEEIRKILKKDLIKVTPRTITGKDELWKMIHETRANGYTYSASELEEGTAAFATPIFDRFGELAASLSIAGLETVLTKDCLTQHIEHIWEASAEVSKLLGYTKEYPYSLSKIKSQILGGL